MAQRSKSSMAFTRAVQAPVKDRGTYAEAMKESGLWHRAISECVPKTLSLCHAVPGHTQHPGLFGDRWEGATDFIWPLEFSSWCLSPPKPASTPSKCCFQCPSQHLRADSG